MVDFDWLRTHDRLRVTVADRVHSQEHQIRSWDEIDAEGPKVKNVHRDKKAF